MITGQVEHLHALLPITFRLPDYSNLTIEFVIDTGFTGYLTLPVAAVDALGLPYLGSIEANLATDNAVSLPLHEARVLWNGQEREVRVLATGRRPLLGTALLKDTELVARFQEGGSVTITELV